LLYLKANKTYYLCSHKSTDNLSQLQYINLKMKKITIAIFIATLSIAGSAQHLKTDHNKQEKTEEVDTTKWDESNPIELQSVVVTGSPVSKVRSSSYNAIAIDTRELVNTNKNLADALGKAPA